MEITCLFAVMHIQYLIQIHCLDKAMSSKRQRRKCNHLVNNVQSLAMLFWPIEVTLDNELHECFIFHWQTFEGYGSSKL